MSGAEGDELVPIGTVLGRYRVVRQLGVGGMGAVYEVEHTSLHKRVAMKVLHPMIAKDASVRARFVQEGEVAARIRHPNVVDVHDVATDGGTTYLVMEYLEGEDLAALLKREGALSPARCAELMMPVLSAIAAAHAAGVVHRDLKPANVFLASIHGQVVPKVLDFGISKILDRPQGEPLTRTGVVMGTPNYMAPEQVMGAKDLDHRADIYALGAILYECATGRRALDGGSMMEILVRIAQGQFPTPTEAKSDLPVALDALIRRAMSPDRAQRFESVEALAAELARFADPSKPLPAMKAPPAPLPTRLDPLPRAEPSTNVDARPLTAFDRPGARVSPALVIGASVLAIVVGLIALRSADVEAPARPVESRPLSSAPAEVFTITVEVTPRDAQVFVDGRLAGSSGRVSASVPKDGKAHELTISAEGFETQTHSFFEDVPPPARIELKALGKNDAPILR